MKMKRVFRRNQIIITTLAIMIAAAGYLNYSGKQELAGADVYEAGSTDLSEEEILAENQAVSGEAGEANYQEIASLDDPVGKYIPEFNEGKKKNITIRNLLTMSGGLNWDEAYASLFSVTTHGYYGNDLYDLVTTLDVIE